MKNTCILLINLSKIYFIYQNFHRILLGIDCILIRIIQLRKHLQLLVVHILFVEISLCNSGILQVCQNKEKKKDDENYLASSFQPVANRQIFAGNLVNAQTVRREKYPREFFPEAKWSRKGFTQTRWLINGFIFDLLNVHLFHDASNILAVERSPSIYSKCRRNALKFTLESLPLDSSGKHVPYVIFGDFNFRLDAHQLVKHISEKRHNLIDKIKVDNSDEIAKIVIRDEDNKPKLTIEKKEFNLHDDHDSFFNTNTQQANLFDFESSSFNDHIFEYEKTFPPSYPYSEDHLEARSYLRARCPAWCDRILLSHSFKNLVNTETNQPTYDIIGYNVCVGDHKMFMND
jgi:inositol-1,4,5-trisphosphate 5-phosphatase